MSALRSLAPHLVLLGVAGAAAFYMATREESPAITRAVSVEVWGGKPGAIQRIEFRSDKLELDLDAHQDDRGRWYSGKTLKRTPAPSAPPSAAPPPAPAPSGSAAPAGSGSAAPPGSAAPAAPAPPPLPAAPAGPKEEVVTFVSVTQANKLAEGLAPLMALRHVGRVEEARAAEFGLDKPEGTLRVTLGGTVHELVFGGTTPGGDDRYVRYGQGGEVYAITGEVARSVLFADSRLVERELHEWKADEALAVTVSRGETRRALVKVPDKKDAWADAASPATQDETAGNWMSKVGRLRPTTYVQDAPPPEVVVRLEYAAGPRSLGWLELGKLKPAAPPAGAAAPGQGEAVEYVLRTEHTRWWSTVTRSLGEQVEQDLGTVLK